MFPNMQGDRIINKYISNKLGSVQGIIFQNRLRGFFCGLKLTEVRWL